MADPTHLRAGFHARAELDALGDLGYAVDDLVEAVFLDEQPGTRDAALAVVEEDRVGRALDRAASTLLSTVTVMT